jgi:thiaminase (transcriptional activator TenA)
MTLPPLSDEILTQTRDVWDAMQTHRFVRDIEADRLDPAVFRRYLAYENAFVETAILIFGYSLVKAPGLEEQRWLIGVLKALSEEQITYFRRAFDSLLGHGAGPGEPATRKRGACVARKATRC